MQTSSSSFADRVLGALKLDPATYEDVEHDENATGQAVAVVAAATILSGASGYGNGVNGVIGGVIMALLGWIVFTLVAYFVGTTILKSPQTSATFGQVLRALGFAYAPSLLYILGIIPVIGFIISIVVLFWSFAASIIALRQSLEVSTGRAVAIAVVSVIAIGIVGAILVSALGLVIPGMPPMPQPAA